MNLEFTNLPRLDQEEALEPFSVSTAPELDYGNDHCTQLLKVSSGDQTSVFSFVQQALYQLSHPQILYFASLTWLNHFEVSPIYVQQ